MQHLPALAEKPLIIVAAVIGEGVIVMLPAVMLVKQRDFGVNAAIQIDPMREILGRGQHQFSQREIARVEIQRPRFRQLCLGGELLFPAIGRQFDSTRFAASNGFSKAQKIFLMPGPIVGT